MTNKLSIPVKVRPAKREILRLWSKGVSSIKISKNLKIARYLVAYIVASNVKLSKRVYRMINSTLSNIRNKVHYASYRNAYIRFILELVPDRKCDICDKIKPLTIDHHHHGKHKGKIRGLLCLECNIGLGKVLDSKEILESMANYLIKHKDIKLINQIDHKQRGIAKPNKSKGIPRKPKPKGLFW